MQIRAALVLLTLLAPIATLAGDLPKCNAAAQYPCLPGIDAIGVGFDAVRGDSRGVGRQVVNFSFFNDHQHADPFGNQTVYSYPDQAKVTAKTTQFLGHNVYRSVSEYVQQQATNAGVRVGFGPWFSASFQTQTAHSQMQDGMHIVAESTCELGVYDVTLDPGLLLTPHPKLEQYIEAMPAEYDPEVYGQFVDDWGTHYVSSATLGGKATMSTVIAQEYYSHQSDSSTQAQLKIAWGLFGGGGGGGSSSHTHDATWTQNANSQTSTQGGDPAVKSFNSPEEWDQWARSVETGSPIVTSYTLDPIHMQVPAGPKRANVQRAVAEYAAQNNRTFPAADPASYQMDWCDCQEMINDISGAAPDWVVPYERGHMWYSYRECWPGYYIKADYTGDDGGKAIVQDGGNRFGKGLIGYVCCRPCFTASN